MNNKNILSSSDSNNSRYSVLSTDATRCISSESTSCDSINNFTVTVNSIQISCDISICFIEFHRIVHEKLNELEKNIAERKHKINLKKKLQKRKKNKQGNPSPSNNFSL